MWKKLKTILSSLFGKKEQPIVEPIVEPIAPPVVEEPLVVEEVSTEPMIKQIKKKRQKKNS